MTNEEVKEIIRFYKETAAAYARRQIRIKITIIGSTIDYELTEDIKAIWDYKDTCCIMDAEVIIPLHGNIAKMNINLKTTEK